MFDSFFLLRWVRGFEGGLSGAYLQLWYFTSKYLRAAPLSTKWFVKMMVISDWFLYLIVEILEKQSINTIFDVSLYFYLLMFHLIHECMADHWNHGRQSWQAPGGSSEKTKWYGGEFDCHSRGGKSRYVRDINFFWWRYLHFILNLK